MIFKTFSICILTYYFGGYKCKTQALKLVAVPSNLYVVLSIFFILNYKVHKVLLFFLR